MLVIDFHALAAVDVLDFTHKVLLHGLFAGNTQDIVGNQRPIDQGFAGADKVAGMHAEVLTVGNEVFALDATFASNHDRSFSATFLAKQFHRSVDLGDNGRFLGLASLENLSHPG